MKNNKNSGKLLIIAGLLCIIASLCLHFIQESRNINAAQNSQILLEEIKRQQFTPGINHYDTDTKMDTAEYLSYSMIGMIHFDKLSLELPVLESWSYDLLQVAPCRYSGTVNTGEFIIMAHNYKSQFGRIDNLKKGDTVTFEDVNGVTTSYTVEKTEILHESNSEALNSGYDLTLFTCTLAGNTRIVVRCTKN